MSTSPTIKLWIALMAVSLYSCGDPARYKLEALIEQRDSLLQSANEKDTAIHQLTASFDEIETNLAEITKKEKGLLVHATQKGDLVEDKREEINRSIAEINALMTSNSEKIRSLNTQLNRLKYHNIALSRMVTILFEHIMYKNNDLADLNHKLTKRNKSIATLNNMAAALNEYARDKEATIEKQQKELDEKDKELNAAYYVLAASKQLKQMCVLDGSGKLMGGFNKQHFKQIDLRKEEFIPEDRQSQAQIVKILTPHPASSYEFIKNDLGKTVNIKIKNRQDFWSRSKYLVVETR